MHWGDIIVLEILNALMINPIALLASPSTLLESPLHFWNPPYALHNPQCTANTLFMVKIDDYAKDGGPGEV